MVKFNLSQFPSLKYTLMKRYTFLNTGSLSHGFAFKSGLNQVFNLKLGCFAQSRNVMPTPTQVLSIYQNLID